MGYPTRKEQVPANLKFSCFMAKKSNVFYKLPIEDMRGKLATKQKDITYSGQQTGETPYNLPEGKKESTNFEKYIVLTKRNGKNRFYVKTRVAVNNTTPQLAAKAALGAASSLAILITDVVMNGGQGGLTVDRIVAANDYYNKQNGTELTVREYITQQIVPQLRSRSTNLYVDDIPDGVFTRVIQLGENTFKAPGAYHAQKVSDYGAETFPQTFDQKAAYRKFMNMLTRWGDGVLIKARTAVQSGEDFTLGTQDFTIKTGARVSDLATTTIGDIALSAIGAAYNASVMEGAETDVIISLFDKKGNIVTTGTLGTLNEDTGKVEPVAKTDYFDPDVVYYVVTVEA